jgi:predicted acetyltransferase
MSFRCVSGQQAARRNGHFSRMLPPRRGSSRGSSRAMVRQTAVAARRQKGKPKLRIRAEPTVTARPARFKSADEQRPGTAIRLASGTDKQAATSKKTPSTPAKSARGQAAVEPVRRGVPARGAAAVQAIDIRPASTVVSRRPAAKRPAILHLPQEPAGRLPPPAWMLEECQVAPARAGDQAEILQLLTGLPSPPTKSEFHAAVDHPDHDSANRLVARLAGRIVGHVEIVPRNVRIGAATVPAAVIDRVAVLPECRGAGHGQRLVKAAEDRMRQIGAVAAFSRTRIAPSFRELGWSVLSRDCATPGRPTGILARLLEEERRVGEPVTMRQWRHVELPAILRIYQQNAARFIGPLDRSEAYSRWLVSRGAFDSIIVALMGQDRYDLHETTARIVGYCVQSGNRVLELMADPEFPGLDREILARVCAEAIENDRQEIVYESSAADPLHQAVAGSESLVSAGDRMIVGKVFRPLPLLAAVAPTVAENVAAAGIRETVELGLDAPGFRGSVIVAAGKATVHAGRVGRSYLTLSDDELARLLLGQSDPVEAAAAGRLQASTQVAQKLATQMFPRMPLWCPMWDDLPA